VIVFSPLERLPLAVPSYQALTLFPAIVTVIESPDCTTVPLGLLTDIVATESLTVIVLLV
jgi:hypothetical protein